MIGILFGLAISWGILYLFEKRSLLALGILPPGKRSMQFLIGFLVTGILCIGVQYLELLLSAGHWKLNESATAELLLNMFWWDFKSVFTEELLFRGAILFILIRRIGAFNAILFSAMAFGIYHWFSFGILGNIMPMIIVFIGTGMMGYAWALAFHRTGSMAMPIGFHLGWNFTFNSIFSNGPLGEGLVLTDGGHAINDWYSLIGLMLVPVVVFLVVKYLVPSVQDRSLSSTKSFSISKANQ
ncbi:CPBP family intramembrane metalloprotease [Gramella jeungdoensis]|uniref:CPBP family intramembrane metalloprotease n=1 Tax=Gramella jeungdoensis TaxID=708091 RepID=A0ABT0YZS6_9FLAO|nr:type II CAAX endopeptidase family protein [Gramella jeungdoensis]MCM8568648.1 CPBP family intramembrane metalloprotease [Gramella jeungdoensis]